MAQPLKGPPTSHPLSISPRAISLRHQRSGSGSSLERSCRRLIALGEIERGWDVGGPFRGCAIGHDDLLMLIERDLARVDLIERAVHIYLERVRRIGTVTADTVFGEA